jgi:hypothetical protein
MQKKLVQTMVWKTVPKSLHLSSIATLIRMTPVVHADGWHE